MLRPPLPALDFTGFPLIKGQILEGFCITGHNASLHISLNILLPVLHPIENAAAAFPGFAWAGFFLPDCPG